MRCLGEVLLRKLSIFVFIEISGEFIASRIAVEAGVYQERKAADSIPSPNPDDLSMAILRR